jgi:hypothetical protein
MIKTRFIGERPLAQCPRCKAVKQQTPKKPVWQQSIVMFDNLPKELCYPCSLV